MPLDPMTLMGIGSLLSGGAGILSALGGETGAEQANKIAALNYAEQQRANQAREQLAREQLYRAYAAVVSPTGTRTYYDQATNTWKTDLSPVEEELMRRSFDALLERLGPEETRRRIEERLGFERRLGEGDYANALLGELRKQQAPTADQIVGDARTQGRTMYNQAQRDTLAPVFGRMRSTGESPNALLAQLARGRGVELSNIGNAPTFSQARIMSDQARNQARAGGSELYNLFAGRAAGANYSPAPTYAPTDLTANYAKQAGGQAGYATQVATNAIQPSQMGAYTPVNDQSLRIGSIGSALGGMLGQIGSWQMQNDMDTMWKDYIKSRTKSNSEW